MKSLILSIALLVGLMTNAFAFNGTIGRSTNLDYAKAVIPETVEKQSLNVKNVHSSTILKGQAVVLDLTADDGASVIVSVGAGLSPLCIMEKDCAVAALCSCQNYGIFDGALFDSTAGSSVAGKRLYMSSTNAGYISARASDLASDVPGGIFYDAASVSAGVQVFIKM